MKQLITLVLAIASTLATAQVVNIPDANFKQYLLSTGIDTNNDGEIQVSEAEAQTNLNINTTLSNISGTISDFTGLEAFSNLTSLQFYCGECTGSISLPEFNELETLSIESTQFNSIGLANYPKIASLSIKFNSKLTNLGIGSVYPNIEDVQLVNNRLLIASMGNLNSTKKLTFVYNSNTSLDLTGFTNLQTLFVHDNNLISMNLTGLASLESATLTKNKLQSLTLENLPLLNFLNCNDNQLTQLNVSELNNLTDLYCYKNQLTSLDVTQNTALTSLYCYTNQLTSLDLSNLENLDYVDASNNSLTGLTFFSNPKLSRINADNNLLQALSLSNLENLYQVYVNNNSLTELTFFNTPKMSEIRSENNALEAIDLSTIEFSLASFRDNPLTAAFLKNGGFLGDIYFNSNDLTYICANEYDIDKLKQTYPNAEVNTYCNFTPGGSYNTIRGNVQFDLDGNGCGPEEGFLPNQKIEISDGTTNGVTYTDSEGQYKFYVSNDLYTITPVFPNGFESQPATHTVSFPLQSSPVIADFCLKPTVNQVQDVSVVAVLLSEEIRPGFPVNFQVIATNLGNVTSSGTMEFIFNPNQLDYVSSDPEASSVSSNKVVWNYSNLEPLKTYKTGVSFTAKTPTDPNNPLNSGDVVAYEAKIISNPVDANEDNNSFTGSTVVVNSFDPNDILCLEGNKLLTEKIGEYVHYRIRFENLGTANAINVVVKNEIDPNLFDISTLGPISSSHDYETRVNGNIIEFIFENINLPFDDATNDGYLVYKIKSLSNLVAGDVLENQADIYFDFNAPVITNLEETEFVTTLSIAEVTSNSKVNIYPNPATKFISIYSENPVEKLSIYNLNGQKLMSITQSNSLNISGLSNGIYLLQIQTEHNNITRKIIKK